MLRILLLLLPLNVFAIDIGVNVHNAMDSVTARALCNNGFKVQRRDYSGGHNKTNVLNFVKKMNACGVRTEFSVQTSFQWNNTCPQDFNAVYTAAYNEATALVSYMEKDVIYYEILNEIQLRPEIKAQVTWNNQKNSTAAYEASSCVKSAAAAARGIADAVHNRAVVSKRPLKVILGVVGRDFGFLDYMKKVGVNYDVIGYHNYPWAKHPSIATDPWFGTGGVAGQLSRFNKEVTWNEFNCGDTYGNGADYFDNIEGSRTTLNCEKAYLKHVTDLIRLAPTFKLKTLVFYELWDEPSKAHPESKFGLLYGNGTPKKRMRLVQLFSGGRIPSGI